MIFKILTILIFSLVNVTLAQIDIRKFAKGKTISHFLNGLEYVAMVYIPYHFFADYWLVAALLFNRLLTFNISLNLFRKLAWGYMPENPKSIIDKIAKLFFGTNGKLAYSIYALIFIGLLLKIFL